MPKSKHTFNAIFNTYSYCQKNKNNLPFTCVYFYMTRIIEKDLYKQLLDNDS